MPTTTISTPLPSGIDPQAIIAVLHDHETMIRALAPGFKDYKLISGDAAGSGPCVYSVTAPTPVGTSTYPLTITNVSDGVDTLVQPKPPVGKLEIKGTWRVASGRLIEDVDIDGNFMTSR